VTSQRALFIILACTAAGACENYPTNLDEHENQVQLGVTVSSSDPRLAELGARIFNDKNLSLQRNQSCASCHDAAWGFTSPNPSINGAGAVMFGSVPDRFGNRKPPTAAYATPSPVLHYDTQDEVWMGGNFWDGRARGARLGSPAAEQALAPFVNPVEQALPDIACVVYRVREAAYGGLYMAVYGRAIDGITFPAQTDALCEHENVQIGLSAADRQAALQEYDRIALAIAAFENSPAVNQFSSKYDAYLAGRAQLTSQELQGLGVYVGKANCAACHPSQGDGALFTDFTFDNIGTPANPENPATLADKRFADLGLGGFLGRRSENGKQKVPTLRNVDRRGVIGGAKSFMHNGALKSLEEVVHFYNTRDVLPQCEKTRNPQKGVNCWPQPEVTINVNGDELGNLQLTPDEEAAVVAFLRTLSDGYKN
jgi:cytochrome c peroxidase